MVDKKAKIEETLIALSSGVVLKAVPASPFVLLAVSVKRPRPEAPEVFMENIGKTIINEQDPEHIERVKEWQKLQSNDMLDALILYGTKLKSTPKDFPGPKSDAWLDKFSLLEIKTVPENQDWRYLAWVKYVAIQTTEDLDVLKDAVGAISGVREADVKAAETFPGRNGK